MKKVACLIFFIFVPVFMAHAAVNPENIVGIWLFDEGNGDIAEDSSGNEHEGQIIGGKYEDGKFGQALQFEGNGEVKVMSTEKLNIGDEFTMMAYLNPEALTTHHQMIAKNAEYLLRIDTPGEGGKMSAFIGLGGWEPRASAGVPEEDTWTHFAAVFNAGDRLLHVYVNGVHIGQSGRDGKTTPGGDPLTFGTWNGGSRFIGMLDEIAIFNVALEEEDIMEIATDGLQAFIGGGQSVEPSAKLTTTWGNLKEL